MPQLHTFRNDLSLSDFSGSLLALSPSLLPRWKASLIRAGILTPEHQTASDLELAGTLLSALSEAELLTFLKKDPIPGNYRNGYVRRCFHFPQGNTVGRIARDRSGLFESHLLPRYRGHIATHVEDLIATAVVTGYSPPRKTAASFGLRTTGERRSENPERSAAFIFPVCRTMAGRQNSCLRTPCRRLGKNRVPQLRSLQKDRRHPGIGRRRPNAARRTGRRLCRRFRRGFGLSPH